MRFEKSFRWCLGLATVAYAATACRPSTDQILVVYSPLPIAVVEYAEERFEEMWANVDVRIVRMDDAEAMERIASGRGDGDVWWGAASATLQRAAADSLLAPYRPSWVEAESNIVGVDAEDRWQVAAVSPFVVAFNRELTQLTRAPRDWVDLYHPRWRGEVAFLDPALSDNGTAFLTGMLEGSLADGTDEIEGFDRLLRLDATQGMYASDEEEAVRALGTGDAVAAVLPLHAVERLRHEYADWLHYRHPDSGAPGLIRGVAMLFGAPQPETAMEFIEMVGGDVAAEVAVQTWWWPARGPLFEARLPDDHFLPGEPLMWFGRPAAVVAQLSIWVERWEDEVRGKGRNFY
ncbi:MAG: solute-binding protein [Gemmatimonadales bacterium]|jgi:iron(III) transport system substrate-binding protein|nr:solute-binding protein [Gemmatimonadales bacterium]MDG2239688.1 substrate-binding domain-containing protein [Longimicrobiales bacterium]MBT3500194.1 solute-binding protein [Gemmatimonadales bacterium]MBT3775655.1 solute-binding protein [Gemmatimonadales bacterium]MBT3959860.1 solute-binding protein [Gemmatimonadales bacterium]